MTLELNRKYINYFYDPLAEDFEEGFWNAIKQRKLVFQRCKDCGECMLTDLRADARRLGYRVMIAEGSPVVMKLILGGHVDAIVGVACLDSLEKVFDKILLTGIPCMAVPLLECGCQNTAIDEDWVREMRTDANDVPDEHLAWPDRLRMGVVAVNDTCVAIS